MARADDYITNESGHISPYDIVLDGIGVNFYGKNPVKGKFGPGHAPEPGGPHAGEGETSLIFNDFSNGMGMAYSGVDNTYAYTINGYARTPRKFMPGGKLTEVDLSHLAWTADDLEREITCAFEWLGNLYIGAGSHILKIPFGTEEAVDDYYMGLDTQIDSGLVYNNIPIFSTDDTAPNWQYLTAYDLGAGAWKTAHETGQPDRGADNPVNFTNPVYLQKMVKVFQEVDAIGGYRLIGNDTAFTYTQTQSISVNDIIGDTTTYGASLECGDSTYSITGIYPTNRIFFITKADGVYGIESSGIYCPNYVPDLADAVSLWNGISGKYFNGKLFVGTPQGVLMIDVNNKQRVDVPTYVSPSFYFANETPVFGLPTFMETDNGWLVVSTFNGTDSHICYARPREDTLADIPNPMIWHGSECTIPGERITMMYKTGLSGRPILWIGTYNDTTSEMHLYTLSLPTEGDPYTDYLHGDGHEFSVQSKMYLPFQDAGDPNAKKVIRRFDVQADGLSLPIIAQEDDPVHEIEAGDVIGTTAAGEIYLYANADAGSRIFFETVEPDDDLSEWVFQGVISDSPKATMIPSIETTSGSQIGMVLVCTLINQETDEELPPVYSPFAVRSIKMRVNVIVEQMLGTQYTVALGQYKATKTGRDPGDMQAKFIALSALQDADAVYMINEWKERVLVKIDGGIAFNLIQERPDQPHTLVLDIGVTLLGRQFYYDVGHPFDAVFSWGG